MRRIQSRGDYRRAALPGLALCVAALVTGAPVRAEIFKYKRADGTWAFTNDPDAVPKGARGLRVQKSAAPASQTERDLVAVLLKKLKPKNAIERASLAVVTVVSPMARGSGFFISQRGHLVTNLHVLEMPRGEKKRRAQVIGETNAKIRKVDASLGAEQRRLNARWQELEHYKARLRRVDYRRRSDDLRQWQRDLYRRRSAFRASIEELQELERKDSHRLRVSGLSATVEVILANDVKILARRVAHDETWDLALLKVDGYRTPALRAAARGATAAGEPVYAIGNPVSLRHSVARGVLSGYERGYIKTDAKIYPGNSGGPLVDEEGRVLGINTFKRITHKFEGLGFAVPIQRARTIFAQYLSLSSAPK